MSWGHRGAPPAGKVGNGHGYDLHAFAIDWEAQQAQCPQGQRSVKWTLGRSQTGESVIRIRFDRATCRACPTRAVRRFDLRQSR